jgi:ABC-type transport system involved in cytochrome c biogenesis ATPase subunit
MIQASNYSALHQKEKSFNSRTKKALLEELITQLDHERKLREKDQQYIKLLLSSLHDHQIPPPEYEQLEQDPHLSSVISPLLPDGSTKSLGQLLESRANFRSNRSPMTIHFTNLSYSTMIETHTNTSSSIQTVATVFQNLFIFNSKIKIPYQILYPTTGRIQPACMTLLMGPPGCGKSSFLKALSGRLDLDSSADRLEGLVTYNGLTEKDHQFILSKLVSYVDELDEHIPLLTVKETFEFAWQVTTGGHHSYLVSDDPILASKLNQDDKILARVCDAFLLHLSDISLSLLSVCLCRCCCLSQVWNIATLLGLKEKMKTFIGDHMIRGVSGGEKRRASIGLSFPAHPLFANPLVRRRDAHASGTMLGVHGCYLQWTRCLHHLRHHGRLQSGSEDIEDYKCHVALAGLPLPLTLILTSSLVMTSPALS